MFKDLLALIGGAFVILAILGAIIPNFNFHLFIGDDEGALKFHRRLAKSKKAP